MVKLLLIILIFATIYLAKDVIGGEKNEDKTASGKIRVTDDQKKKYSEMIDLDKNIKNKSELKNSLMTSNVPKKKEAINKDSLINKIPNEYKEMKEAEKITASSLNRSLALKIDDYKLNNYLIISFRIGNKDNLNYVSPVKIECIGYMGNKIVDTFSWIKFVSIDAHNALQFENIDFGKTASNTITNIKCTIQ